MKHLNYFMHTVLNTKYGLLSLLLLSVACQGPKSELSLVLPQDLPLSSLSEASQARLRVIATIPGVLEPSPLQIDLVKNRAVGSFTLADTPIKTATLTVEVFSAIDENPVNAEVLLARGTTSLQIRKGKPNKAKLSSLQTDGDPIFDLNRNGISNFEDLLKGIDPSPGVIPVDISPQAVSFTSGIEVGGFTRSFFVVENTSDEKVELSLDVRLAPGVTIVPLPLLFDNGGASASSSVAMELGPRSEEVFALTFAPANKLFLVGSVAISTRSVDSGVEHSTLMRMLGNPEGAVPQAPSDYIVPMPPEGTPIGNYTGVLTAYPADSLFSRAPNITRIDEVDAGGIGDIDIDAAYMVAVLPRHRFAATLDGLVSDVDLHLFEVDAENGFVPLTQTPIASSVHAGLSSEAVEFDNTGNKTSTVVLLLAFDGVGEVPGLPAPNGNNALSDSGTGTSGITQTALFSVPEFLPPCIPDIDGVVEPGCQNPISSVTSCPAFYGQALACGKAERTTQIVLRGRNFKQGLGLRIGSGPAICTSVETIGDAEQGYEQITCLAPPAADDITGEPNAPVILTNPDGQAATLPDGFTYLPPSPVVFSVAPGGGPITGGTPLSVQGTGFFAGESGLPNLKIGDQVATDVIFVSSVQLRATLPPCPGCANGKLVDVAVTNPDEQSGALFLGFEYRVPKGPGPNVVTVNPAVGHRNGGTSIDIIGTGFKTGPGTTVRIGGATAPGVNVKDINTITAITPPGAAGPATIEVINPDGQTGRAVGAFTFEVPAPVVAAVLPGFGPQVGGTTVLITGRDFQAGAQVLFADTPATNVNVNSSSSITCTSPAGLGGAEVTIQVQNLDGQSHSLPKAFRFEPPSGPPPTIASVSENKGSTAGGDTLNISGTGFLQGATVLFGQSPATSVTVTSSVSITAISPPHSEGVVGLTVRNSDGQTGSLGNSYAFITPAPAPTGALPIQGPTDGGTLVQLFGSDFVAGATVTFGNAPALDVLVLAASAIRCTAPAHLAGVVPITVTNPDGQQNTVNNAFTFIQPTKPAPTIDFLQPTEGSAAGGARVEIRGKDFDPTGATVTFDNNPGFVSVGESTSTLLVVTTPAGTANTSVTVRVQNGDGQTDFSTYRYTADAPPFQVSSIVPNRSEAYQPTPVFIVGQAMLSDAGATAILVEVQVGGWRAAATNVVLLSDQLLSATLPAYAGSDSAISITADIIVTKTDGGVQTSSLTGAYTFENVSECSPNDMFACGQSNCTGSQCVPDVQNACLCNGPQCQCLPLCGPNSDGSTCGCGGVCGGGYCSNSGQNCPANTVCDGTNCVDPCGGVCTATEQCIVDPTPRCLDFNSCNNDNTRNYPEQCDGTDLGGLNCFYLGFDGGDLECDSGCKFNTNGCNVRPNQCNNNSVIDPGEACDKQTLPSFTDCTNLGFFGGTLACTSACTFDVSGCTLPPFAGPLGCGNNRRDPMPGLGMGFEACDGSDLAGVNNCEALDFVLGSGVATCTSDCRSDLSGCAVKPCGDGRLTRFPYGDGGDFYAEECDGPVFIEGVTCERFGRPGGTLSCTASCTIDTSACTALPATCKNGTKDTDTFETDIDCGGINCAPCNEDQSCANDTDCLSGVCAGLVCAPANCTDNVRNGREGDIDCGLDCPALCAKDASCSADYDCDPSSAPLCVNAKCALITCTDNSMCPLDALCDIPKNMCINKNAPPPPTGQVTCPPGDFVCAANSTCLVGTLRCNGGPPDCGDNSDEFNCTGSCNGTLPFVCSNGIDCVSSAQICNGTPDCSLGLDEAGFCGCPPGDFLCADGIQCLPGQDMCGNASNCQDGSDEVPDTCSTMACGGANTFVCQDQTQCISPGLTCDGNFDCADQSDESDWACPPWLFRCGDGPMFGASVLCDSTQDCPVTAPNNDEALDKCSLSGCDTVNNFLCDGGTLCVPNSALCDGTTSDCTDGSDEDFSAPNSFCNMGHCFDTLMNVDETQPDCGGADCKPCP